MSYGRSVISTAAFVLVLAASGCGNNQRVDNSEAPRSQDRFSEDGNAGSTLWDLFSPSDTGTNVKVNKYIWNASLDCMNTWNVSAKSLISSCA